MKLLLQDSRVNPGAGTVVTTLCLLLIDDNFAIRCACKNGHIEVVRVLLQDRRVDPSARNNLALALATDNGHSLVVQELLKHPKIGAKPTIQRSKSYMTLVNPKKAVK